MKCENCNIEHNGKYGSGRFCGIKCARGFSTKNKRHEINKKVSKSLSNKEYVKKIAVECPICKRKKNINESASKRRCTDYCLKCLRTTNYWRSKVSAGAKGKNGGYRKGSGNGLRGTYKGFWCDSSWELAFIIYNLEHNINIQRNKKFYYYKLDGIKKKYYPDFIVNDVFYEIKGYRNPETTKAKLKYFPHKIVLIGKKEIYPYLEYVEGKYGKDFVKLYNHDFLAVSENAKCQSV